MDWQTGVERQLGFSLVIIVLTMVVNLLGLNLNRIYALLALNINTRRRILLRTWVKLNDFITL
jgi:hypothetical protein